MKNAFSTAIYFFIFLLLFSPVSMTHAAPPLQTASGWVGTYRGTLPCADCEGIYTELSLNPNQTYKLITRYIGKKGPAYVFSGKISWNKAGTIVTLAGMKEMSRPSIYHFANNALTQTDMNGNPHAGELAAKYVMQKGEPAVEEKYWKLTSLYGIGVEKEKTWRKEPHIMLVADENRLNGSGHCNIISGNYVLTEGGGLKFSQMVLTKTECENMDIETNLAKVLEMIDGFTISGDTLKLHKAKMVPSAVFVAVYPK
jgi:uncharacterized lipoprotein NlpE involved in copper resistance